MKYKDKAGEDLTLTQLFEHYINESQFSACLSPQTIKGYREVFHLFLRVMPEVSGLQQLTTNILFEYFKRIQTRQRIVGRNGIKTGVKKSTIKTHWSKLNVFFTWLYNRGYILNNPLTTVKVQQPKYDDYKMLEDHQIHKLYSAIARQSVNSLIFRRDTLMISLLLFCGLRKGEFISLQVRDCDLHKKLITIRAETSKSRRSRVVTMHPTLVLHLREYLKERNRLHLKSECLLVSSRGDQGLTKEGLKHWTHGLFVKSGVKFHLHQFRHTFACKLAQKNVSIFKIQKFMGHQDISMTMKYIRSLIFEDMQDEIDKISI